jgi:hypothetical protein
MTTPRLTDQAAVLFVASLARSLAYWTEKVGFSVRSVHGDPPMFAILARDERFLMLRQAAAGQTITPYWRVSPGLWNAYFWTDDARALFEEIKGRGAIVDYELCEQPYGVLEFGIRDLDDQDIGFGQVLQRGG